MIDKLREIYMRLPRFEIDKGVEQLRKELKEAGWKSPEEVIEMFKGFEDTINLLDKQVRERTE